MGQFAQQYGASIGASAIGSGIQFGLNTAGGLINQAFAKRNAKIQANYNKELMQTQYELQKKAIDEQNAYNSPAQQMQRLQDAGLNPNLAYQSLSNQNQISTPNVSSPAPANYQQTDGGFGQLLQYVDLIGKIAQVQKTINDTDTTKSKVDLTDANALVERWKLENFLPLQKRELSLRNLGLGWDNAIKRERSYKARDLVSAELRYQDSLADKMLWDSTLSQMQAGILPSEWKLKKRAYDIQYSKDKVAVKNMRLQNSLLDLTYGFEKWSKDLLKQAGIIPGITSHSSDSYNLGISFGKYGSFNYGRSDSYNGPIPFNNK